MAVYDPDKRYKLIDQCLFVDAKELDGSRVKPQGLNFPHLMDSRQNPSKVLKFNDTAGFIARFILSGVKISVISQIVLSEFGNVNDPAGKVKDVFDELADYLEERLDHMQFQPPTINDHGDHSGVYELDFRVNFYATTGVSKLPIG